MASVADKRRAHRARMVSLARTSLSEATRSAPRSRPAAAKLSQTGLEWLHSKGRISDREFQAGRRYGSLVRISLLEGDALIKSCLDTDGVRGAGTPTFPGKIDATAAAWKHQAVQELAAARAALGFHTGMIAACDLICGRGDKAREISSIQREAEEIENGLRIALQILVKHWATPSR